MYIWGLQCNHHMVTEAATMPDSMKCPIDSAWRRKYTLAECQHHGHNFAGGTSQLDDQKGQNVLAVLSFCHVQ